MSNHPDFVSFGSGYDMFSKAAFFSAESPTFFSCAAMAHGDPDEKTFLYILYLVTWQRGGQIWAPQNPMV